MQQIYLDYNATTPVASEVFDAMVPFLRDHYGNPSSGHALGRACREAIDEARGQVATLLGAEPEEIYFTGGGTESNNLALKGIFLQEDCRQGHLVTSCFEHPAIKQPAIFHQQSGGDVTMVESDKDGRVKLDRFREACTDATRLVSMMHANNEIGVIQPIREISALCQERSIPLHTDASQSVGKIPTRVDDLGVDLLTIAGHKLYAPKGVGALYVRHGVNLVPSVHGADHERGLRPGTENVAFIVGLGVAAKLANQKAQQSATRLAGLRDRLESLLFNEIPGLTINGKSVARLPNTSSVNFPNVAAAKLVRRAPELCISTGAACHSDSVQLSDTLRAIGLTESVAAGTIRISIGRYTTEEEIDRAASLLVAAWEAESA